MRNALNTGVTFKRGAVLVALGLLSLVLSFATPGASAERPGVGTVGNANPHGTPPGQVDNLRDNGWQCDGNKGAGQGNPAQAHDCVGGPVVGGGVIEG